MLRIAILILTALQLFLLPAHALRKLPDGPVNINEMLKEERLERERMYRNRSQGGLISVEKKQENAENDSVNVHETKDTGINDKDKETGSFLPYLLFGILWITVYIKMGKTK